MWRINSREPGSDSLRKNVRRGREKVKGPAARKELVRLRQGKKWVRRRKAAEDRRRAAEEASLLLMIKLDWPTHH